MIASPRNDATGEIRNQTRAYLEKQVLPTLEEEDRQSDFRRDHVSALAELGLASLIFPKKYGGQALPFSHYLACIETLAEGSLALAITISVHHLSQGCLFRFGSDAQKEAYLPLMSRGKALGAFSLSEPQAGSDAANVRTAAVLEGDHYRLNGTKSWCTSGGHADLYVVMARTGPERSKGLSSFLVTPDLPGWTPAKQEKKLGIRTSPLCQLVFEDCQVPLSRRLGEEGDGLKVALSQLDNGRMAIAAASLGIANESLRATWQWKETQATKGIAFDDAWKHRLAQLHAELSAASALLQAAAERKEQGQEVTLLAAECKLLASELAFRATNDAVECVGPEALRGGSGFERRLRDARALPIVEGTSQVQRFVIARQLGSPQ